MYERVDVHKTSGVYKIHRRMEEYVYGYLSEFIYGSIDGIITTFSIVAGSAGGNLAQRVILVLGISNVLSDGYSMGISRYLSALAEEEQGLIQHEKPAWVAGLITFLSFVIVGMMPILPFVFIRDRSTANKTALGVATLMFFMIGVIKGWVIETYTKDTPKTIDTTCPRTKLLVHLGNSGTKTMFIGLSAAMISYGVGRWIG